ncbi:MAG TPA: hypothetical protein VLA96_07230 [Terriglobales bacterium]|nr:hypothetical protein [Terriglobales bacterium]
MKRRLTWALSAYAVIAMVAYLALPDKFYVARVGFVPMSVPVILLMALLAFRSVLHRGATMHGDAEIRSREGRE